MRMHIARIGAAFGVSIIVSLFAAQALAARADVPVFACFNATQAQAIGLTGAGTKEAQDAFAYGACLALPAGTDVNGDRVSLNGGTLYAVDARADGFSRYLPVTASLLERGRALMHCSTDAAALQSDIDNFTPRWRGYWMKHIPPFDNGSMKYIIYVGDEGPRLFAEKAELDARWLKLNTRCGEGQNLNVDSAFAEFLRRERGDS